MNATTNVTTVDLTLEYWIQYVVFYLIIGIPGIIGNFFVFILIVRHKKLHTFFFTLIAGHAMALALFSIELVIVGVFRICRFYMPELYYVTRLECHLLHLLLYFFDTFSSLSMCVLAFDRTLAIVRPLQYHNYQVKHALYLLFVLAFLSIFGKIVPAYLGTVPFSQKILCVSVLSPAPPFWSDFYFITNVTVIVLGIFLYILLFVTVTVRTANASRGSNVHESIVERMIKRQLQLLPAVRILLVVNVFTVLSFNVLMLASNYMEPDLSARLFIYGVYLSAIDRFVDPLILLWKSTELRRALKLVLGLKNQVQAVTISGNIKTTSFVKPLTVKRTDERSRCIFS